jgi:hypothetical protein
MKKENIGSAIILAGIAIIGFIWFKRNKPQTANKQLGDLTAQSNAIQAGSVEGIDKPFEYSQSKIPSVETTFTMGNLTPQQIKDIKNSIGTVFDPTTMASNQIAQNMQNANFTQLDGIIGVANIDWSKVKIK